MPIRCLMGGHRPAPGEIRNQGFDFSRCRRCRCDMVRSASLWRSVPRGFRVVWKRAAAAGAELSARQLLFDLPVTGRSVILMSERARSRPADMLALAVFGLRCLLWIAAERLRNWVRRAFAARAIRQPVIYLPAYAPARTGSHGS